MMAVGLPEDLRELLGRLNRGIAEPYGERYRGLVLFGSYARGEARKEGSDVDLLVLLEGEVNGWREYLKIEPVSWPLSRRGMCCRSFPSTWRQINNLENPFLRMPIGKA